MKIKNTYDSKTDLPEGLNDLLGKAKIPYSRSKQDVWEEMSSKLSAKFII